MYFISNFLIPQEIEKHESSIQSTHTYKYYIYEYINVKGFVWFVLVLHVLGIVFRTGVIKKCTPNTLKSSGNYVFGVFEFVTRNVEFTFSYLCITFFNISNI